MAGIKGVPGSYPFDRRRNGLVPAEGAAYICIEDKKSAGKRGVKPYAYIRSIESAYDGRSPSRSNRIDSWLEAVIRNTLAKSGLKAENIDCISCSANSSDEIDCAEAVALKRVFSCHLKSIPIFAIKSMIGETFSASGIFQILSVIGVMQRGVIPPTINYKHEDASCKFPYVINKAIKKGTRTALIVTASPNGYSGACIVEKT